MIRKSQILKLITLIALVCLFIILLMNIFNSGVSYHYINVERKLQRLQEQQFNSLQSNKNIQNFDKLATDLKLDYNSTEPSIYDLVPELQKKLPSLPIEYFYRHANSSMQKFKNCAQFPALQVINFYNTYWQTLYIDNSIFQLYGAYYDERPETGPVVRVLAMTNHQLNDFPIIYCQLWYENDNRPVIATIKEYKIIWEIFWGVIPNVYYPYLMTCELPKNANITGDKTPKVVNLVGRQCDTASNSLRIFYDKPAETEQKPEFAVCVKGLDFPYEDLSVRLVEWLELLKTLGVHKVYMHHLQVHNNISKVLNYYQAKGFVEIQNITLVGGVVDQPAIEHWLIKTFPLNRRLNELITYNDCFYRNMYKYKYIALLDIDEIIMPINKYKNWQQLVKSYESENICYASLCATNAYFPLANVPVRTHPSYMHMLNYVYRHKDFTKQHYHIKCLHNTKQVVTLHNHYPLSYLNTTCKPFDLPTSYAQLQHYRDLPATDDKIVDHVLVLDDNIERYRTTLIESCTKVLRDLKFLS